MNGDSYAGNGAFIKKRLHERCDRRARRHDDAAGDDLLAVRVKALGEPVGLPELVPQACKQAHAVFKLRKVLVGVRLGNLKPCDLVELVGREDEARAVALKHLLLERLRLPDHRERFLLCVGAQRVEVLAVAGQTHGHQRHRQRVRREGGEVGKRSVKFRPVVDFRAEHHLAVKAHAVVRKTLQVLHDPVCMDVGEHLLAQLAVGRLDGDVNGAGFALNHAVHFRLGQVGQRHKVAGHQRKPPVVVTHIQARAHARRHLLDEAEHAVVRAGLRAAHQRGLQRQPQGILRALMDMHRALRAGFILKQHLQGRPSGQKLVIHQIQHRRAVDGDERFSGLDAAARGKGAGEDAGNALGHAFVTPLFQINPTYYLQIHSQSQAF